MGETLKRSYYSDASHNYMVLSCPPELRDNYQYKMLAANRIRGLLPCSGRTIDNQEFLYYDITSRQSLADLYDRRPVRGADLQRFLEDLARIEETLAEYLLDTSHIIPDPACIYVDFREQECCFAYYPGEAREDGWEPLFAFIADRVDGRDKQAAALAYRLCMMAQRPGFVMRKELLEELGIRTEKRKGYSGMSARSPVAPRGEGGQQRFLSSRETGAPWEARGTAAEAGQYAFGGAASSKSEDMDGFRGQESERSGMETTAGATRAAAAPASYGKSNSEKPLGTSGKEKTASQTGKQTEAPRGGSGKGVWITAAGGFLLPAGIFFFFLGRLYPLAEREMILTRAAGGLMAGTGILLLIIQIIRKTVGRRSRDPGRQTGEEGMTGTVRGNPVFMEEVPSFGSEADNSYAESLYAGGFYEGRLYADGLREGGMYAMYAEGQDAAQREQQGYSAAPGISPVGTAAACGETSLLHPGTEPAAGLYGTGTFRGEKIRLDRLPCVVGKAGDYVDQVLEDNSVSRMHARFSMGQDGKLTIRDLNSTNGTWLNGERLSPNESRMIQPGDRIRMGRMEFVYR
ncbi:MAG: DUF6382 domain-containing protein [Eubacteriales bacterium]|nr:DUF6382 domain-containing protein [Eubacteriales bacterium]